jgi:hypothetical protein
MTRLRVQLVAVALAGGLAACGGSSAGDDTGDDTMPPDAGGPTDEWDLRLGEREVDYSAALRIAALRLTGELPTLVEVRAVADAPEAQRAAVYESLLRGYLADPRFARQMMAFWQDTLRLGDDPQFDQAAAFAAQVTVEGRPYTELLTAAAGTCATYDAGAGTFAAGDCANGVATHAGLLSHPAAMRQFYGNMAFRRVRWVQETFACTAFPAESSDPQDLGGVALYTGTWPFESIAGLANGGRVDFLDLSAVACANCHSTMNHLAPLFANFDDDGVQQPQISVLLPTDGTPAAQLSDWLPPGETTAWRLGVPTADLPALGAAMAADPLIAECAIARVWNWAMGKGDIVDTLAVVPTDVIAAQVADFQAGGHVLKDAILAAFTSDDFVQF